ncbi:uncharacterized protein ACB058_015863 [Synchiropus picturatus]
MDKRGGNNKAAENGIKGADPYSVETPYGFQLDLDFLKYVDDIEKGNTIKRVPIQRRSKGPRASTLPRHLNASAGGYRPSPWGSTGALGPRTDHHGNTSWAFGHRSPTGLQTMEEMEARIREFDAQPLGEYIRPNLLRASSLPLTVLLRQSSESADELSSIQSSRLGRGNISCEDICGSTDSIQDNALLLRRLSEALERVQALEREVKVIPDLQSQISSLQEEKERLCSSLKPMNGTKDPYSSLIFNSMDSKRPRKASPVPPTGHYSGQYPNATQEWRNSSDLDELLTVTSLQAKVAALEQKLCETKQELQRVSGLLRRQQMEGCVNDSRIRLLSGNLGVWVEPERTFSGSSTDGIVTSDFMAACHFLSDHMENMENPNNEMRDALIVLFQSWFTTAAEEDSEASKVSVYVKEVKRATPTLLAFLVNLVDDNGNTVLHYSVSHCNYSIVSLLLDTGVSDVNLQNKAGYTPVMLASLTAPDTPFGMEVVRRLMEGGCINIRSGKTGQTALHLAVRHGRVVMVRLLLSCGADANVQDAEGTTALMFATEKGYTHIARLLLERSQCDLTLTDERGRTALSIAKLGSHSDTSTLLQAHAKARALHC